MPLLPSIIRTEGATRSPVPAVILLILDMSQRQSLITVINRTHPYQPSSSPAFTLRVISCQELTNIGHITAALKAPTTCPYHLLGLEAEQNGRCCLKPYRRPQAHVKILAAVYHQKAVFTICNTA